MKIESKSSLKFQNVYVSHAVFDVLVYAYKNVHGKIKGNKLMFTVSMVIG